MTVHYEGLSAPYRAIATPVAQPAPLPEAERDSFYARRGKRMLDIALVLASVPLLVPLMLLIAAAVMIDGGRPFFAQTRVGRHGRAYQMWKFRTMRPDAERELSELLAADPAARREWDERQKLKHDPRVTRFGALLRKTSLDELPQLWNVLRGDMSLVGPRPMLPSQQPIYPGLAYYALRPGLTGPWQVSERNQTSFAARARFDDLYHARLSLGTDIRLLLATLRVVVRGTGC
ncbi:MAG: sugar transferase [Gemmobacter sp.]